MKTTARVLCLVFALCFLFVSCDSAPVTTGGANVPGTSATGSVPASTVDTEEGNFVPMEGLDFGGEDFVILTPESVAGDWAQFFDFLAPELTEEPVNDANYERIALMKQLYNVNIVNQTTKDVLTDAQNAAKSGDNPYDAIHIQSTKAPTLAQAGALIDLKSVSTIDLTNPWYNQNAVRQLSIANKLFFVLGDISTVDNDGIAAISFNKEMVEERNLTSPYEYIENDTWTLDVFYEMCKGLSEDLDGDGDYDNQDQWGYLAAYTSGIGQLISSGVQIVTKDENDYPVLSLYTDRNIEAIEKVFEVYADTATTFHVEQSGTNPLGVSSWQYGNNMFMEGRLMFRQTTMSRIIQCRQSELEFGIIPYPKLDADQENYAHTFSLATPFICILNTAEDPEANGAVVEALSYYGRTVVRPAYYERVLKGLVARDEESEFCLDIIFDSSDYDLGIVLSLGDFINVYANIIKSGTNTFSSEYDRISGGMETTLQEYIDAYESIL